jgi:hypothetical protein
VNVWLVEKFWDVPSPNATDTGFEPDVRPLKTKATASGAWPDIGFAVNDIAGICWVGGVVGSVGS